MPKQGKDAEQSQNETCPCIRSNFPKPMDKRELAMVYSKWQRIQNAILFYDSINFYITNL